MADRQVAQLGPGAACCGWNHCGRRLAAGAVDGSVSVYDSQPSPSSKWQAHECAIVNVVWLPPEYGDAIACVCADGTLSLWEEVAEDDQLPTWRKCKVFEGGNSHILNVQFGLLLSSLKMVTAYSDGQVKVYELLDSLELDKWQLQAEFQNITDPVSRNGKPECVSASIAWSPRRGEGQQASFVIGFNSDSPHFNSCKGDHCGLSLQKELEPLLDEALFLRFGSLRKLTSAGFRLLSLVHRRIREIEYML
ncbi:hypothetical protein BRADI_2g43780v3 [Brachypodium distachyon]|uniref:Anaphase-promoting complex subunit 4 WD40 domain-containing protein n=1 Tax=Brachypodium distachyon TaxID=15368 RepID=I1HPH5_BRADI|nr:hypothetical protein BRADI_2g43780v3 [Brachypodium distachyon]